MSHSAVEIELSDTKNGAKPNVIFEGKRQSRMSELQPGVNDDEDDRSHLHLFLFPLNAINHVLAVVVTGYLVYLCRDLNDQPTNQHAVLCTIGYVFLMSEAIVALAGENLPTRQLGRRANAHVHWVLQAVGAVLIFAGGIIKYIHREEKKGGTHLTSTHSVVGFVSVVLLVVVSFSGLPALFAARLRKRIRPVFSKFTHNLLGITCYAVGMASQCLAYPKKNKSGDRDSMVFWMTLGTALITVLSLVGALRQLRAHSFSIRKSLLGW